MTIVLTPDQVIEKYGKLFCKGIYTMVDEENGVATIIEECSAKGPVEWDAANRRRAGGASDRHQGRGHHPDHGRGHRRAGGPLRPGLQGAGRTGAEERSGSMGTGSSPPGSASPGPAWASGLACPKDPGPSRAVYPERSRSGEPIVWRSASSPPSWSG